ncbi:MAG: leucyl aminopeptidase family protein [Pseudomonadota bacterium]
MTTTDETLQSVFATSKQTANSKPIYVIADDIISLPETVRNWIDATVENTRSGFVSLVPSVDGQSISAAVLGLGAASDPFFAGNVSRTLNGGEWHFEVLANEVDVDHLILGYALGAYRFNRYKSGVSKDLKIHPPQGASLDTVLRKVAAVFEVRDLVNTPANDMGPSAIEAAARRVARSHKATIKVTTGDELLKKNFPLIHTVGRAASEPPRLIDIRWGRRGAPKLTLVGKGVAYDTGGLNIKPGGSMRNMKKDMGGAAHTIALAGMIMDAGLDVRLRLLIPAVENSISAPAFRPGDIYPSRKGLTVEIGNTDAEGRLILADALALGDEEKPDLMVDFATLTGAARVALGPDVAPFFTNDDALATELASASVMELDPIWRMPLWQGYAKGLSSSVADCGNISSDPLGGAITAALFLQKFVEDAKTWIHFDVFAWSSASKPHAPVGGEAQGLRALFSVLESRYPRKTKA